MSPYIVYVSTVSDPQVDLGTLNVIVRIVFVVVVVAAAVVVHLLYSGRQTCGRTRRGHTGGRSHRISHPPSFCGACLSFSREKDSAVPFPSSTVKYTVSYFVCSRANSSPNVRRVRGYQLNHRGDRLSDRLIAGGGEDWNIFLSRQKAYFISFFYNRSMK